MKLEVGMYVRTDDGEIGKITHIETETFSTPAYTLDVFPKGLYKGCDWFDGKASYNIIDLIERGDYVNGYFVTTGSRDVGSIYIAEIDGLGLKKKLYNRDINSIVTKEQFESMSYKVGD